VLGFCSGLGAGGAILVIRRDQTADAVWPAGWRRVVKGWRCWRDGSNAAAIFVQTTGELCAARARECERAPVAAGSRGTMKSVE